MNIIDDVYAILLNISRSSDIIISYSSHMNAAILFIVQCTWTHGGWALIAAIGGL